MKGDGEIMENKGTTHVDIQHIRTASEKEELLNHTVEVPASGTELYAYEQTFQAS